MSVQFALQHALQEHTHLPLLTSHDHKPIAIHRGDHRAARGAPMLSLLPLVRHVRNPHAEQPAEDAEGRSEPFDLIAVDLLRGRRDLRVAPAAFHERGVGGESGEGDGPRLGGFAVVVVVFIACVCGWCGG